MDLDDLFDAPKVRLNIPAPPPPKIVSSPASTAVTPVVPDIAADIADMLDDDCPYPGGGPGLPGEPEDGDLEPDIADRARAAAKAHDVYAAAKAAFDEERSRLQKDIDEKLATLKAIMSGALSVKIETEVALETAMKNGKITTIPMTDRPDIKLKTKAGSKQGIKKGWLVDPENLAVKAYEGALNGSPLFKSGVDFAGKLWDSQPKSEGSQTLTIPDAYEDEPDRA